MTSWEPILKEREYKRATAVLHELALALEEESHLPSAYLYADLALFFAYLGKASCDAHHSATAIRYLERAIEACIVNPQGPALYDGLAGLAWIAQHLSDHFIDVGSLDLNVSVDETLLRSLDRLHWTGGFDLISGLVGIGVYFLERLPRRKAEIGIRLIVDRLRECAENYHGGIAWRTPANMIGEEAGPSFPHGRFDVGVAHGVPGVVAFLARVDSVGIARRQTQWLINNALSWFRENALSAGRTPNLPYWIAPEGPSESARCAWCYGNPGVACALLLTSRLTSHVDLEAVAIRLAKEAASRPIEECGVVDAALCHGASGLGHLFNRLFQATRLTAFRNAAESWFQVTLEMRVSDRGTAGYLSWGLQEDDQLGWYVDNTFLTGAAGIGLALLSATTPVEPNWDRLLLCNLEPISSA